MIQNSRSPPTLRVSSCSLFLHWVALSPGSLVLVQSLPSPPSLASIVQLPWGCPASDLSLPFAHCDSRAGWSATKAAMSSLTTSSEGENSTPRFVVGSRDDETEFLGSNMKTDETDFFEDDEEEESVRRSQHSGLEHLCGIPGSQPGFAWLLLGLQVVGSAGDTAPGCVAQLWDTAVAFMTGHVASCSRPHCLRKSSFFCKSDLGKLVDFFVLET